MSWIYHETKIKGVIMSRIAERNLKTVYRNMHMMYSHMYGKSYSILARRYNLTPERVRRIVLKMAREREPEFWEEIKSG